MAIVTKKIRGNPKNFFDLPVTVSGFVVTVGKGSFKIAGKVYDFLEERVFEAVPATTKVTEVRGFIAENLATGFAELLVDEVLPGEAAYMPDGVTYKLLLPLFQFDLPPTATSLDEVEIRTKIITKRRAATQPATPQPEPEPPPQPEPEPPAPVAAPAPTPKPPAAPKPTAERSPTGLPFFHGGSK